MNDSISEYIDTHTFCNCHACKLVETRIGNVVKDVEVRNLNKEDVEVRHDSDTDEQREG